MKSAEYYNTLRIRANAQLLARRSVIFRDHPEIEALHRRLTELYTSNPGPFSHDKELQIALCKESMVRALEAADYPSDSFDLKFHCALCKDTGNVEGTVCACAREDSSFLTFSAFELGVFPEGWQYNNARSLLAFVQNYVSKYPNLTHPNIVLIGDTGLGKTFLLRCLAGELAAKGANLRFLTAYELIHLIMQKVIGEKDYTFLSDMQKTDVLCVDDLGSEPFIPNITSEYMFSLINERMINALPTLFATNLMADKIAERYGTRVASRLFDQKSTRVFQISGEDLRLYHL